LSSKNLKSLIKNHKKIISIYGLGNVGGPIAAVWLRKGAKIIGVDISKKLLSDIEDGKSHQKEPFVSEIFSNALKKRDLSLTSDGINASQISNIKILAVPVGLKEKKIELSALISSSTSVAKGMKKGDSVIISPSLPPGTTRNIVLPILEKYSKLKGERDFNLIYNPERIFEGRAIADIEINYPAIVSGLGPKSLEFGYNLLKIISQKGVLTLSKIENAEAEKLFEGVYRDVNIALANELADYCERVNVNYWEARIGANSQPYCHLHYPGTGVGGLCIPVYPRFVINSSKKIGKHLKLLEFSRKTNDFMPIKCVNDSLKLLTKHRTKITGTRIAVLGLGFRGDVTDSRLSPTYMVVKKFLNMGFKVTVHDPYIFEDKKLPSSVKLTKDLSAAVNQASLIFISADHKIYSKLNTKKLSSAKKPLLIFDGRNIIDKKNFKNTSILTLGLRN
jgi:nucleotide sugar dehydrogenase